MHLYLVYQLLFGDLFYFFVDLSYVDPYSRDTQRCMKLWTLDNFVQLFTYYLKIFKKTEQTKLLTMSLMEVTDEGFHKSMLGPI